MKLLLAISTFFWAVSISGQVVNPFDIPQAKPEGTSVSVQDEFGQPIPRLTDTLVNETADTIAGDSADFLSSGEMSVSSSNIITQTSEFSQPSNTNPFEIGNTDMLLESTDNLTTDPTETSIIAPLTEEMSSPDNIKVLVLVYALAMLVILTLAISLDRKRFGSLLKSCINSNNLKTLHRENKSWENGQSIILYVFFFFNLAFVIWLIALKTNIPAFSNLFFNGLFVILCYAVRHFVMWSISSIYPVGAEVSVHNFSISVHNMILGILLLPIILAIEFMPGISISIWIYIFLAFLAIIYILRQAKGFLSCVTMRGFNPFYFFIYLCAVEIAPFLVGYKMMLGAL